MNFTIHIVISNRSFSYLRFVLRNYRELCSKSSKINFRVYCLDRTVYHRISKSKLAVEKILVNNAHKGSTGHSMGLSLALKNFTTGHINIISDADVCVLVKNWDVSLLEFLTTPSSQVVKPTGVIGVTYENINGFSTGNSEIQTYKKAPTLTWCLFMPDYDFSKLDPSSEKNNLLLIDSTQLSKIFGLPQGYSLLRDVGWQLPLFLIENSIPYLIFDHIKPSNSDAKILAGAGDYHDEFHYDNLPFLVHQRGSMKHAFRLSKFSKNFYNRVDKYLDYPNWFTNPSILDYLYFGVDSAKKTFFKLLKLISKKIK